MNNNFLRIDETLEIDHSYITCAEYQLFINHCQENNIKIKYPDGWKNGHFPSGESQKLLTGINWENANKFCAWLSHNYIINLSKEYFSYYRLPTSKEREKYSIQYDKLTRIYIALLNISK